MSDIKTEWDYLSHINGDKESLARELRRTEPNEEFINRLIIAIIKSATKIAEIRDEARAEARRQAYYASKEAN